MDELLKLLFSPDADDGAGAGGATETEPLPQDSTDVEAILAEETARIEAAADEYYAAQTANGPPSDDSLTRKRDANGRFVSASEETPTSAPPAAEGEGLPSLDKALMERAKVDGIPDTTIATFKSDADLQAGIKMHRMQMLERLGIDPMEFVEFRNSRGKATTKPEPEAPVAAPPVPTFKLDIDENEMDPATVKALRSAEAQFNDQFGKAKAELAVEQAKTREAREAWEKQQQQSAEAAKRAQEQSQLEQQFDTAAAKVAGFTGYFGKPSELNRIAATDPGHSKVQDLMAFNSYFAAAYTRYQQSLGPSQRALEMAISDAWEASPFSKIPSGNGTKNTTTYGPGSVPRGAGRMVTLSKSPTAADSGDIDAEMKRIYAEIDKHGGLEAIMAGGGNGRI